MAMMMMRRFRPIQIDVVVEYLTLCGTNVGVVVSCSGGM